MKAFNKGIAVSPGIAIGKALKIENIYLQPDTKKIEHTKTEVEKQRFTNTVNNIKLQLEQMISGQSNEKAEILTAHLSILEDPYLESKVISFIEDELQNAEAALSMAVEAVVFELEAVDDEYLKERAADVKDVYGRMLHDLKGITPVNLTDLPYEAVIISNDLTPSQTATMDLKKVLGFAINLGGRTSHTAILARSMEIPAVVGCTDITSEIKTGDYIIIDGSSGNIIIEPSETELTAYREKQDVFKQEKLKLSALINEAAVTRDGRTVELSANAGNKSDITLAAEKNADGIGLFRTEFLYMEGTDFPTENAQFATYKNAAVSMNGKPVIIRTLDIGGDKDLSYYDFEKELNPFLGYRAIRLCLDRTDIFKTQLRAILRASAFGKLRIMYPMVISLEEIRRCNQILKECKYELESEGVKYDENIEVGIMIETPAAVVLSDKLSKHVDFFSIGTNDLTQYTLCVDRGNEKIQKLYDPFNPAVLHSIKRVIEASHKAGKWTGMCGEFAGDEMAIPVLLGMDLDEFSMSASSILKAKEIVRGCNYEKCKEIAVRVLEMDTAEEIKDYLKTCLEK